MPLRQKKKHAAWLIIAFVLALIIALLLTWLVFDLPLLLRIITSFVAVLIVSFTVHALYTAIIKKP